MSVAEAVEKFDKFGKEPAKIQLENKKEWKAATLALPRHTGPSTAPRSTENLPKVSELKNFKVRVL